MIAIGRKVNDLTENHGKSDYLKHKVCMVTGASSGIGKATAIGLANMGANVVLACRNEPKAEAAAKEIASKTGNDQVSFLLCDLSLQDSIRGLTKEFENRYQALHILVNNAGTYRTRRTITEEGIETTFAVNYLAPFLLTNLLIEKLKASAPSRIVNVAGAYHRKATMNFNDLMSENKYDGSRANNMSKLALVLFTYELARRLDGTGVTANCLHPGAVATGLVEKDPDLSRFYRMLYRIFSRFASSPEKGAETSIYLAASPEIEGVTGKYFEKKSEKQSSDESYDLGTAKRLWEVSLDLTNLKP
ncbi:MAG: SDR family oxidoreductase, partial [Candidatus Thorarchaeota archaeon]